MDARLSQLFGFFEQQRPLHAKRFPSLGEELLLGFLCTTSRPETRAAVAVSALGRLEPGAKQSELRVHLRGPLPATPGPGECVTVHLTRLEQYQGYQVKTAALGAPYAAHLDDLFRAEGDGVAVQGRHTFTVHHSPYTMRFFEQIPFDEVQETVGGERHALVAVGENANVSPRFVWHVEELSRRPALYHGDGLALKTYMNLRANPLETRLVLDLDTRAGYALRGETREVSPDDHPEAWRRVNAGFAAGDWGHPARMFRFVAEDWQPIAPG